MKNNRRFSIFLALVSCCGASPVTTAWTGPPAKAVKGAKPPGTEKTMIQPSDLFPDFPKIKMGMSFQEVKKAVEKIGAVPAGAHGPENELAWDGTFNGIGGRATVLFKADTGACEIAVIAYAMSQRKAVFARWLKKISAKQGAAQETVDNSTETSKVWRLKNGAAIELRTLKDVENPVVDVHWVKS